MVVFRLSRPKRVVVDVAQIGTHSAQLAYPRTEVRPRVHVVVSAKS
jgi:hypothetical protein